MNSKRDTQAGDAARRKKGDEDIREARAGETGTTRFGFVGDDSVAKDEADREGAKK